MFDGRRPAPQADDGQPVPIAEPRLRHRLADQVRQRGDNDLGHADLLRPVGEIRPGERLRLERIGLSQGVRIGHRREHVNEQDVANPQLGFRGRLDERSAALDGDEVGAGGMTEADLLQRLTDERRCGRYADPVFAARELVRVNPIGQAGPVRFLGRRAVPAPSQRRANIMYAMPRPRIGRPKGVKLKK